jgi:hypothetical protein
MPMKSLLFRVEDGEVLEYIYRGGQEPGMRNGRNTMPKSAISSFLDEPFISQWIAASWGSIKVSLAINQVPYIYRLKWSREFRTVPAPPTVKEVIETIIGEAHDTLDTLWSFYPEDNDIARNPKGPEDRRYWVTAFLVQDKWRGIDEGDVMLCLRRVSVYL